MRKLWIGMLAAGLLLAACGGSSNDAGAGGSPSSPATSAPATATPTSSPSATATSGETKIDMEDFTFAPSSLTVSSGAALELDNEGQAPHTFTIDGQNVDVQVNAGANAKVTIDLSAGSYDFYCKFHKSQGMTGTLTVA